MDLQPEMRNNMLMRNGLQAHVALDGSGYRLIVQGHNSPLLVYPISERQMLALTDWNQYGQQESLQRAHEHRGQRLLYAQELLSMPAMPTGVWLWGCTATASASASTVAWDGWECPRRSSAGRHATSGLAPAQGRRPTVLSGPSIVPERPDRRMKPGELQSGGYGFYYKGINRRNPYSNGTFCRTCRRSSRRWSAVRAAGTGTVVQGAYSLSGLFFQREIEECLCLARSCRGCGKADADCAVGKRPADMVYDLTEKGSEDTGCRTHRGTTRRKTSELLNGIIGADFSDKVTMEALNSDQRIAIGLHPEVQQDLEQRQRQEQEAFMPVETSLQQQEESIQGYVGAAVDGRDLQFLNENKGWYREEEARAGS